MPRVSVIMPVFNAEKFLSEAINSILQQTFKDFEFIIIDDGSTDISADIIKSYQDPRIRFYQNPINLGISETLNKGIRLSSSEYIGRMDADDISYPTRLQKQVDYLEAHPECAMVSSLVRVISEDKKFIRQDNFGSDYFYYNLTFICWIYHPTVMYTKEAVTKVNMYTETYAEDFELFWQISRQFTFYNLPEVLLDYRTSSKSLHHVLKFKEYEAAQRKQIVRNIQYYTGKNYSLPISYIECYRHNLEPLLAEQNAFSIIKCIKFLDFITQCILTTPNPNKDNTSILRAAKFKRRYILKHFYQNLPFYKSIFLLVRLTPPIDLLKTIKKNLKI